MKKIIYIVLVILICLLGLKACVRRDIPEEQLPSLRPKAQDIASEYKPEKNVTINGIDYLQSQNEIGNFGGTLVSSTIGEGPKTFNPFNTKDNISSQMSEIMYDGLVTTNPVTGETIPKLAKSFEVKGNDYIVHLRKGVKWSDGKPITADDVFFTWQNIIFDGFGNTSIRDSVVVDGKLPTVKKIDDYTVKFTTPKPFAPFLRLLASPIAPKHIFEPAVKKGKAYFDTFQSTNIKPETLVTSELSDLKNMCPHSVLCMKEIRIIT